MVGGNAGMCFPQNPKTPKPQQIESKSERILNLK